MLLLLLLLNIADSLTLVQTPLGSECEVWVCDGYTWDAQQGDTLFLVPDIPVGNYDKYVFAINGDARYLGIYFKVNDNLPSDWTVGVANTQGNRRIKRNWHPWDYYTLDVALIAKVTGSRYLRIWFIKYKN